MKTKNFARALERWGMRVVVHTGGQSRRCRAFFQPMKGVGTQQSVPTPLGQVLQDRFLYLGAADVPLDTDSRVEVDGEWFRVEQAHPVFLGQHIHHWRAICTRRRQEAVE